MGTRRKGWIIVGVAAMVVGAVWALQGLNILGGSSMTGNPDWVWAGLATVLGGGFALIHGLNRRQRKN